MGGPNSGWRRYDRRAPIVEDCCVLDLIGSLDEIIRHKEFTGELDLWQDGCDAGSVSYELRQESRSLCLVLRYAIGFYAQQIDLPIKLAVTRTNFGGVRWWGRCPLNRGYGPCNRRVGRLYLPLYERYFGCRRCYGLTYRSSQEQRTQAERERLDGFGLFEHLNSLRTGDAVPENGFFEYDNVDLEYLMPDWDVE